MKSDSSYIVVMTGEIKSSRFKAHQVRGSDAAAAAPAKKKPAENPADSNPTQYGDWQVGGRCIDF